MFCPAELCLKQHPERGRIGDSGLLFFFLARCGFSLAILVSLTNSASCVLCAPPLLWMVATKLVHQVCSIWPCSACAGQISSCLHWESWKSKVKIRVRKTKEFHFIQEKEVVQKEDKNLLQGQYLGMHVNLSFLKCKRLEGCNVSKLTAVTEVLSCCHRKVNAPASILWWTLNSLEGIAEVLVIASVLFQLSITKKQHYRFVSTGFTSVNPFRNIDSSYKKVNFYIWKGLFLHILGCLNTTCLLHCVGKRKTNINFLILACFGEEVM